MHIATIMNKTLNAVSPDAMVTTAIRQMCDRDHGAVLVVKEGKLLGVFTERDLLRRVVGKQRNPALTKVAEVASMNPVAVQPDVSVKDCYDTIVKHGFRHMPVVDGTGTPVGMISTRDFLKHLATRLSPEVDLAVEMAAAFTDFEGMMSEMYGD